ncbi:uncharacterized protein BDZ99DRAFT_491083 [Mytilinidion resinicola]|uniref:Uncharacterized protein n=1 Tax=Mytilinidion resinicola TaxID=574789 RepID=A0A6A6Y7L9_9PEZI|nr:uncharacterized protein BDZ99DRAFT_491083 [Mytilinidion resinicola]KAF2804599.1 hypothetical protein BDZ99DRAFT_491083 [Mytilinidion resinicola]
MAITYEPEFAPSEQASLSVDALVNDADPYGDARVDFEDGSKSHPVVSSHVLEHPRRATPTIPPGFSAPSTPKFPSDVPLRPHSRAGAAAITPAVPVIPATPVRPATPLRAVTPVILSVRQEKSASRNPFGTPDAPRVNAHPQVTAAKVKEKVSATSKALEKTLDNRRDVKSTTDSTTTKGSTVSGSPSKQVGKGKRTASDTSSSIAPSPARQANVSPLKESKSNTRAVSTPSKRQPPGKLDISAATKLSESDLTDSATTSAASKPDTQARNPRAVSLASTGSHPPSPAVQSAGSPVKRSGPRTLRVVPMPKSENAPPLSASSAASTIPQLPTVGKLRSRQASLTSLNQPGTPASDLISDTTSITSASLSRANSPPPGGKVGTAPIRQKSKAQAKKDRQERAKQIAAERFTAMEDSVKSSDPEPVQAPIIGRKKKAKKPVTSSNATSATPAMSQPASPKPTKHTKADDSHDLAEAPSSATAPSAEARKSPATSPPDVQSPVEEASHSMKGRGEPTAASILADLQRTGDLLASTLEFFKPLSASLAHTRNASPITSPIDPNAHPSPPDLKIHFSEADLDALAKKMPVRLGGEDGKPSSRTLITPQGKFLWGLSKELEERVLELEQRVEEVKGIARWHDTRKASRRQNGDGPDRNAYGDIHNGVLPAIATALKEAGAKLGKQSQSGASPAANAKLPPKPAMSFDEALGYLNQWVLPHDSPADRLRSEQDSVGGPAPMPPSLAAAAKIVAAGSGDVNTIPIPDLENLGVFAAEVLGGYVVQGLESLVGAGAMGVPSYGASAYGKVGSAGHAGAAGLSQGAVLSVEEAEQAMLQSRKEAEQLEKKLNALVKRNKRMLAGTTGGK